MAKLSSASQSTKDLLRSSALTVITKHGVRGVTYRRVSDEAGVALGLPSYHYENIDELLLDAFTYWVDEKTNQFLPAFSSAQTEDDIVNAALGYITSMRNNDHDKIILFEFYAQIVRDSTYKDLGRKWSSQFEEAIKKLYPMKIASRIETIVEGIGVQFVLQSAPKANEQIASLLRLAIDGSSTAKEK